MAHRAAMAVARCELLLVVLCLLVGATACSCNERVRGGDTGPGFDTGSDTRIDGPRPDVGDFDPFDPMSACGLSIVPTERVPGSLLLVFDRSGSMNSAPGGGMMGPSKWDQAKTAINGVLTTIDDELSVGLLLFPTDEGSECDVVLSPGVPHVPIDVLPTSRPSIMAALDSFGPSGGNTPLYNAARAGYDHLDTLDTTGQRGLILVTDGAETCDEGDRDAVLAEVETERTTNNYLTYVVGLTTSNNVMSEMAVNGGTRRSDTCVPECNTPLCNSAADCPGMAPCFRPIAIGPGQCQCNTDAECPPPLSCTGLPIFGNMCTGSPNCCHYNATESSFATEFEAALEDIARRFLESCVFEVPIPADPTMYDPTLVNVGVTFDGEERTVLPRSSEPSEDSWNFTTPESDTIIIQGPICDRLLMGSAVVEIVLGCPTILI